MAVDSQNLGATLGTKRGVTVYQTNPSVPAKGDISRPRRRQLGNEQKGLVIEDGTGAILGRGTAVAYEMAWQSKPVREGYALRAALAYELAGLDAPGKVILEKLAASKDLAVSQAAANQLLKMQNMATTRSSCWPEAWATVLSAIARRASPKQEIKLW